MATDKDLFAVITAPRSVVGPFETVEAARLGRCRFRPPLIVRKPYFESAARIWRLKMFRSKR